jgi:serine/threonine-protein kinase
MSSTGTRGVVIGGRYRLIAPIGRGAMGEVWRAEHVSLNAPVAVKLLDPEVFRRTAGRDLAEIVNRFHREAKAAAKLRSPYVVQIHDHGVDNDVPYIAMELLEGETLADRLDQYGRLPNAQVARIIGHVARAMEAAHDAGIVHRDLKPENVFLVRHSDEEIAKVLDFGIAKLTEGRLAPDALDATQSGLLVGTPCYMSPEQAQGTKTVDWRSDLWSLAVMAYECICGERPFDSKAVGDLVLRICTHPIPVPSERAPVPPGFDAWWHRASCREPEGRFQSARELADALRSVLDPWSETTQPNALGVSHAPFVARGTSSRGSRRRGELTHRGVATAVGSRAPQTSSRARLIVAAVVAASVSGAAAASLLSWPRRGHAVAASAAVSAAAGAIAHEVLTSAAPAIVQTTSPAIPPPPATSTPSVRARPAARVLPRAATARPATAPAAPAKKDRLGI